MMYVLNVVLTIRRLSYDTF
uniref:Uncharacterized protein n=1 Tax=Arundo donax TaxID=35708 RepID=A0A0A9ETU2_ARUDO